MPCCCKKSSHYDILYSVIDFIDFFRPFGKNYEGTFMAWFDPSSPQLFTTFTTWLLLRTRQAVATRPAGKLRECLVCSAQLIVGNSARSKGATGVLEHQDWTTRPAFSKTIPNKGLNSDSPSNRDHFTRRTFVPYQGLIELT